MPRILRVVVFILLATPIPTMAQLPPETLADSHLLRAKQGIRDGDPSRARPEIDKIRLLQQEHDLDLSDESHFRYAKARELWRERRFSP